MIEFNLRRKLRYFLNGVLIALFIVILYVAQTSGWELRGKGLIIGTIILLFGICSYRWGDVFIDKMLNVFKNII